MSHGPNGLASFLFWRGLLSSKWPKQICFFLFAIVAFLCSAYTSTAVKCVLHTQCMCVSACVRCKWVATANNIVFIFRKRKHQKSPFPTRNIVAAELLLLLLLMLLLLSLLLHFGTRNYVVYTIRNVSSFTQFSLGNKTKNHNASTMQYTTHKKHFYLWLLLLIFCYVVSHIKFSLLRIVL